MDINGIIREKQAEIAERIDDYIEFEAMVSTTMFATNTGIDPSGLHKMLKGQMPITKTTLSKISKVHNLSMNWLLSGEEPMYLPAETNTNQSSNQSGGESYGGNNNMHTTTNNYNGCGGQSNTNGNIASQINDSAVIMKLLALLEEKDRQIATRDKQISDLIDLLKTK